jgi:hypothetical protein
MKRLIAFLLFAASCSFAQVHFIIINADTKKPLVHIPERFGEKILFILTRKEKSVFPKCTKFKKLLLKP